MLKVKKILKFARPVYHRAKPYLKKIRDFAKSKRKKLVFTFQGRVQDFGIELYENDPEIRDTIRQCNALVIEMGGPDTLSYFERQRHQDFSNNELNSTGFLCLQLAISKSFIDRGVFPNAVLCSSSGMVAGAYAAGAINIEEALRLSIGLLKIGPPGNGKYQLVYLGKGMEAAKQLCHEYPLWLEIIYQSDPQGTVVCCNRGELDQLTAFLDEKSIAWTKLAANRLIPYHTYALKAYREEFMVFTENIKPTQIVSKPLKCDFYFDGLNKVLPKNSIIDYDVWFNFVWKPALFTDTLQSVLYKDFTTFLQIGSPPVTNRLVSYLTELKKINIINTFEPGTTALKDLSSVHKKLSTFKFQKQPAFYKDDTGIFNNFLRKFDTKKLNPIAAFQYIKAHGNVHYLPRHRKWLVLGYDDVDYILKNPEIFSSFKYKLLDPYLLAADPAPHKVLRSLVQPMFSPKILDGLGDFATIKAAELLETLFLKDEFDFMQEFAGPLQESVMFHFWGLSEAEAIRMKNKLNCKPSAYLNNLNAFLDDLLKSPNHWPADSIVYKIKTFVDDGSLAFDVGKSLLRVFWVAGVGTTTALIGSAIGYLFDIAGMVEALKDDPELIPKFIAEALRLSPPVNLIARTTKQAVELGGKKIPANAQVVLSFESANRDPKHFSNPNSFLLSRQTKRNFSFGTHIHQCIGMGMARTIINKVIVLALDRAEEFRKYKISEPTYFQALEFKIISTLKFTKAKANYLLSEGVINK